MELARLLGYLGDSITFISGILLSWDAIRSESEFIEATSITEGLEHPLMKNVKVKLDQLVVTNGEGVERVFRRACFSEGDNRHIPARGGIPVSSERSDRRALPHRDQGVSHCK